MRYLSLLVIMLVGVFFMCCKDENSLKKKIRNRPNVVYINVDDLGWKDLGFMDDGYFETPHIDQFAKQAMLFTNSYASAANCAPSRAYLMTWQYALKRDMHQS